MVDDEDDADGSLTPLQSKPPRLSSVASLRASATTLRMPSAQHGLAARSPGSSAVAPASPPAGAGSGTASHHGSSIFMSLAKAVVGAAAPAPPPVVPGAPPADGSAPRELLASRDEAQAALARHPAPVEAAPGSPAMMSPAAVRLATAAGGGTGVAADEAAATAPQALPLDAAGFYGELPASIADLPDAPDVARWELLAAARAGVPIDIGGDTRVRFEVVGAGAAAVRATPAILEAERALCALAARLPALTYEDVRCCFLSDGDAQAGFRLLDQDVDGSVTRDEFTSSLCVLFNAWAATQSAVASFGGVSGAIEILLNGAIWMCV